MYDLEAFKALVWNFYAFNKRVFEWRKEITPYKVVVSEIMLQQTQTDRVAKKFSPFIDQFPDFKTLAQATQSEVLMHWIGLGYNRRALALHAIAQKVVAEHDGNLPSDVEVLQSFKGLGHATASSIAAFAFNKPTCFIETNIRSVYLHNFFFKKEDVHDKELMPLIHATVDKSNPREWYYALMDYGVHLKKLYKNPSRKSRHHTVQSKFEGSDRQIRGEIIRLLLFHKIMKKEEILLFFALKEHWKNKNIEEIIFKMVKEGLVCFKEDEQLFFL